VSRFHAFLFANILSVFIVLAMGTNNMSLAAAAVLKPSNGHSASSAELSYDTQNMTHRSAKAEWQPHRAQTTTSQEWWYFTALFHDASGNRYMLYSTIFKYDGMDIPIVKGEPEFASKL